MKKINISVVLVVKNEEKNIERCLTSVKDFADEIIVVDDSSTDKTVEIAKKFTDKIFLHKSLGYVEPARNFAISKATGDFVLILDADEELTKSLGETLRSISEGSDSDVVVIPRKNITFSSWIKNTGWWPDYQIRFFRKGKVIWKDKIHSVPEVQGIEKKLEAKEENALVHHNYQSISQFILKLDRYTTTEAEEVKNEKFRPEDLIKKPAAEFVNRFFSSRGYKDGVHGLALSLLMAFYILVVELKKWEEKDFIDNDQDSVLEITENGMKESNKILRYWFLTAKINEAKNPLKKILLRSWRKK